MNAVNLVKKIRFKMRYRLNDAYNDKWILRHKLPHTAVVPVAQMKNDQPSKQFAQAFHTVWLRNMDRILKRLKDPVSDYAFMDVGCGRGIATLYAATEYDFRKAEGFDFEESLIDDANINKQASPSFKDVNFFVADASTYVLPEGRYLIFMFNPFDAPIMQAFMVNNIDALRRNKSAIAYANYHQLDIIKSFEPAAVTMIESYRCALITF
ncbi:MAG: hypothetical protein JWO78_497 [Micavibrio sp.]|nr:hypothetical protein [Micavibrio sp.]